MYITFLFKAQISKFFQKLALASCSFAASFFCLHLLQSFCHPLKILLKTLRGWGVTYVPSLSFKTCFFMYWGGSHVTVSIFLLYLYFSLSRSHFQPIFVLFVTISAVLCCCFKAMSLVRIYLTGLHLGMEKALSAFDEKNCLTLLWNCLVYFCETKESENLTIHQEWLDASFYTLLHYFTPTQSI